jgi:hypothetical protein
MNKLKIKNYEENYFTLRQFVMNDRNESAVYDMVSFRTLTNGTYNSITHKMRISP